MLGSRRETSWIGDAIPGSARRAVCDKANKRNWAASRAHRDVARRSEPESPSSEIGFASISTAFDRIALTRDSGLICVELVTKVEKSGFRVSYVPVHHYHRLHGRSQFFNLRRVGQVALGLGRLWWELIVERRIQK